MLPLYVPPDVELAWATDQPFSDEPVRRLAIEIEGAPHLRGRVRVRCRDGEHLVVDSNQLFQRPGGHTSNVLMFEEREHPVCELAVQDFHEVDPLLFACMQGGTTRLGRCDPPLDPVPAGATRVHDFDAHRGSHPIAGDHALYVGYRVLLGRNVPRITDDVRTTIRCGDRTWEETGYLNTASDAVAGESWVIGHVLADVEDTCRIDVRLGDEPLGSWTLSDRPGTPPAPL